MKSDILVVRVKETDVNVADFTKEGHYGPAILSGFGTN